MSRTWPAQSTGSTDEYETDNYSWPSDDSSYDDANDNGFYGGAASSGSRIGGGAAAARTKGSGTKSSGGSGSGSRGGANNNLARAGSGSASSSKATSSNSNAKRGGASTRKNPGTKSRDGDSDIELLSSDDDDSVVLPSSPKKRRGSTRKAAAKAKKRIIDDSDDEYETDEEVVEKGKKSGGSGSGSRGESRRSSRGGCGRRALRNINDNKSNAKGGKGKSNDSDYEDEEVEEDEDEEYIDDAESRLSWSPSKNKRRKVQSKDSDLSDGFDSSSDDSFDLGRNRSKALAKRRRKALNQGFSSSDEDSSSEDDGDSKPKSKRKAPPSKASSARAAKPKSYLSSSSDSDSDDDVPSGKRKGPPAKSKPAKASKPSSIDSDSDSSIEFLATSPPPRKSPRRKTQSPAKKPSRRSLRRSTSRGSRKSPPESIMHYDPSVRAATTKALEESRKAREALRAAQKYHAKEVELPDVEEAEPPMSGAAHGSGGGGGARRAASVELVDVDSPVASQKVPPAATSYSGPTIRLTLRYQHPSNNKECKSIVKIKMDQPLTHLQEEFKLQQDGKCEISVANFDGDKLDWVRTPNNYEMEDEDLVDVVVKLGSPRGSGRAGGGASQASDVYTIHVRPKGQAANSHTFKIKKMDPLSKLVTVYCQQHHFSEVRLEYNGRGLDPTKSLYEEGLPSVAHLDAVVMGETGVGGAAAGSGGGGGRPIQVKFRINGKSTSIETISVPFKSQFRSAMASFAEKRQVTVAQCKFIFDGEDLRPMDTPEGLDLEGGEIVDVVMPEKPAGNPVSSASVAAKKPSAVRAAVESTNNSNSRARTSPRRARTSPPRARTSPRRATASPPANAPPAKISVKTNRNRNKAPKQKTWKLVDTDTLSKLKEDYVKLYKSKGCRSVKFYFENQLLQDVTKTFRELGIGEGDMMYAMENGKVYKPV